MADDIGELMRKIRVHKNLSQEHVAEEAGIDSTTYSRYERGETQPKFETVVQLAQLYKMTLDEFYHFGDPNFKAEESKPDYLMKMKVNVIVELDGKDDTLNFWFKRLTSINKAI